MFKRLHTCVFSSSLPLLVLTLGVGLGSVGCDKGSDAAGDSAGAKEPDKKAGEAAAASGGGAGEAATGEVATAAALEQPPQIDDEIMADLKAIVANCEVNVDGCTVNKCANDEKKKLTDKFQMSGGKRAKNHGEAIDTFAAALADADTKLQTAAVSVLYSSYNTMPDTEAVSPAASKRMIEAWSKLPRYQANQSVRAVVHSAMLTNSDAIAETLYKAIEAHPDASKGSAYEALMTHGRLRALPKLEEVAKSDDEQIASAALTAFRNMYEATDDEKAKICPWIVSYLGDTRANVYQAAGWGAIRCSGEYVDKLLDEGEKRLENHSFDRTSYFIFRDVCFSFMGEKTAGQQAQCDRNYAFLQKAVDDDAVDSEFRSLALDAIYYQRRDATTKALASKYTKHKDEKVAERAKEIVEKLKDK